MKAKIKYLLQLYNLNRHSEIYIFKYYVSKLFWFMIFNQIKYKWKSNNIEISENILSSMPGDTRARSYFYEIPCQRSLFNNSNQNFSLE